jgi:hypothetical protein
VKKNGKAGQATDDNIIRITRGTDTHSGNVKKMVKPDRPQMTI